MLRAASQFVLGIVAFLAACELVLRLLPVSTSTLTGYYFDPDILTYPAGHRWSVSTGWDLRNPQTLHSNNFGFAADHDFVPDPHAVALIGDSYVESSMLAPPDRPGAQLERALGGTRRVYAMGAPGTSLLDYAERIRFAHERFGVRDFVVFMERGDVRQALCGCANIHRRCLDPVTLGDRVPRRPEPSAAERALRHFALAQYLSGQLKIEPARLLRLLLPRSEAKPARAVAPSSDQLDVVTATFFERVRPHLGGRLVIVMNAETPVLRDGHGANGLYRQRFIELARAAGANVIDLDPVLRTHFEASALSLDVGPYDGHLNPLGVRLLAEQAAAALKSER
jgi:hypothetical protein